MPLVDERGRLLGRVNVIDAALAAVLLVLLPIAYTAARLLRTPNPQVERVEPPTQPAGPSARRIRVIGRNLRPYLTAVATKTGEPSLIAGTQAYSPNLSNLVMVSPSLVEIDLPELGPGQYDLRLYDTTKEVARLIQAFTLTPPPEKPVLLRARVRFAATPELVKLVHDGDEALNDRVAPGPGAPTPARVAATLTAVHVVAGHLPPQLDFGGGWGGVILESDVQIPARQNASGEWLYGAQVIRTGEGFNFRTARYTMSGQIGDVRVEGGTRGPEAK